MSAGKTTIALTVRQNISLVLALIVALGSLVTGITAIYTSITETKLKSLTVEPEALDKRIEQLTSSLNSASKTISEIEKEIERRKSLVLQLKADADESQKIKSLNAEQVAAVAQALRGQLKEENRDSFWSNTITNIAFAFLGALFGEGIRLARSLWLKRKTSTTVP